MKRSKVTLRNVKVKSDQRLEHTLMILASLESVLCLELEEMRMDRGRWPERASHSLAMPVTTCESCLLET